MRQLKSASSSSQHDDPATSDDEGPVLFPSLTGTLPPSHLSGGSSGRASPLPVAGLAGGDEEVSFPAKPRGEVPPSGPSKPPPAVGLADDDEGVSFPAKPRGKVPPSGPSKPPPSSYHLF
nr:acidic proline-rich protein PRP25 [Oryza sativa Japonica Group]